MTQSQKIQRYIGYIVLPVRGNLSQTVYDNMYQQSKSRIENFMKTHPQGILERIFTESGNNQRHRHAWPELNAAISMCLSRQAHLVVAEIRNLTRNEAFAAEILALTKNPNTSFDCQIYCCDQPCINRENLAVLVEHAQEQRKIHGQLIKAGLSKTTAKSGNPNASLVIAKVNKPKIDSAIQFALFLQPIIAEYRHLGYSQRKMVNALNEEGFTAPEGGLWVLSQLQKVLDRIKMNESALTLESRFKEHHAGQQSWQTLCESLNQQKIPSPKGKEWTEELAIAVNKRIEKIREIAELNKFVIELTPIINKYPLYGFTESVLIEELKKEGIRVPVQSSQQYGVANTMQRSSDGA